MAFLISSIQFFFGLPRAVFFPSLCLGFFFSMFVFSGWWGAGPSTQPPTWKTSVFLFVWMLSFDLSGKGGPTSSYATARLALWIIAPRKPPYPARDAFFKVEPFIILHFIVFTDWSDDRNLKPYMCKYGKTEYVDISPVGQSVRQAYNE